MIINSVIYDRTTGLKIKDVDVENITESLLNPDYFLWMGLKEPSVELMQSVRKQLNLHELAVEDAYRAKQRTKFEAYENSFFMTMQTAVHVHEKDQSVIKFGETHIFAGINFIVSIRHGESSTYAGVRARCEHNPRMMMRGPGYITYALLDHIVDDFFPIADDLRERLDLLEKSIFNEKFNKKTIYTLFQSKRELARLDLGISPLTDICKNLMLNETPIISKKMLPYYRDVHDHILRIHDIVNVINDLLDTSLDVHLALVNVKQNETVKKLASWAGLIAIPTMFSGFWGMNFEHMPELGFKYGYPFALSVMTVVSFLLYKSFKRNGWL
jgi:magnesium transporter